MVVPRPRTQGAPVIAITGATEDPDAGRAAQPGDSDHMPPGPLAQVAVALVRRRELREVALDAGGELLGVVLGAQELELLLPTASGARVTPLPPEPGGQARPLGSHENCDGTSEQSDPEPAHTSIVPTPRSRSDQAAESWKCQTIATGLPCQAAFVAAGASAFSDQMFGGSPGTWPGGRAFWWRSVPSSRQRGRKVVAREPRLHGHVPVLPVRPDLTSGCPMSPIRPRESETTRCPPRPEDAHKRSEHRLELGHVTERDRADDETESSASGMSCRSASWNVPPSARS